MSADDDRADLHRPTRRPSRSVPTESPATWTGSVRWADAGDPAAWMPGGTGRAADDERGPSRSASAARAETPTDAPTRALPTIAPAESSSRDDGAGASSDAASSDAAASSPRVGSLPLVTERTGEAFDGGADGQDEEPSAQTDEPVPALAETDRDDTVPDREDAEDAADGAAAGDGRPEDSGLEDADAADGASGDGGDPDEGPADEPGSFSRRLADDPRTGTVPRIDLAEATQREAAATEDTIYELRTAAQHLEEVLIGGKRVLTRKEVAQLAEVSTLSARKLWRSLGQPRIPEGEAAFTVSDAAPLRRLADLVSSELVDEETALQLSRAIGQMTDRLVVWQMEAMVEFLIEEKGLSDSEARRTALDVFEDLIDPLQDLMVYAWRRNLAGALGRLNVNVEEGLEIGGASRGQDPTMPLARGIGFIDLVSYTRLSQQLDSRELSRLVKKFQFLAYNIVAAGGGKVIKTVGDEVFFAAETPLAGADIAMTLLEQVTADESLPRCRVGFSWGRVLSRMGDIFGTTVNLAARLTAVADPNTVVTDADTARIIERDDAFEFTGRRDLTLQGLGEVGVVEMHRLSASTISTEDIV